MQACPLQGLALKEIFKKGFPCNIIGRRPQEIYIKLEEKIGRKCPGPKVGKKYSKVNDHKYTQFTQTEIISMR